MNNFTALLLLIGGTILLKIVVTWVKGKLFDPYAVDEKLRDKNLKKRQQEKEAVKRKYDEIYQDVRVSKVDFDQIAFSNQEWENCRKTVINNTTRLNNYYNSNIDELLVNSVEKCYEYYQETYSSVNIICNQAGVHNVNVRHIMDLFCLTIIQSSLWATNAYINYPYENMQDFKKKWEYTDMQSKVQTINNMLNYIKKYPISADILPRYNHATQFITKLKQQYNFRIQ